MVLKNYSWTLKTALHGTEVTRLYPEFTMELPDAFRGIHELDATKCIGCGACVRACTNSCIELVPYKYGNPNKNKKMQFPKIDYGRCMFCGLCVDDCPTSCLTMSRRFEIAGWDRESIIYGPDKLATVKHTEEEVAKLAEEARIAAEKKKAAKKEKGTEEKEKKKAKTGEEAEAEEKGGES
jgi:NADH-quinone oxidoreductase subunit I